MKKISVVLCTFNGEKYIYEQLKSIENQSLQPFELIIVDDNSTDSTINKIKTYMEKSKLNIRCVKNTKRKGVVKNFEYAISIANGDYIALSDQDDVWLKDKLKWSLCKMMDMERNNDDIPILIHTDMKVVDENLHTLDESFMNCEGIENKINDPSKYICVHNYVTGCTTLLNKKAVELILPFPNYVLMHDWWIAFAISMVGRIGFINSPTVLYRQHGCNVLGAHKYISIKGLYNAFKFKNRLKRIEDILHQLKEISNYKNKLFIQYAPWIDDAYTAMKNADIKYLYTLGIKQQGTIRNILFYIMVFVRKISQY